MNLSLDWAKDSYLTILREVLGQVGGHSLTHLTQTDERELILHSKSTLYLPHVIILILHEREWGWKA